MPIGVPDDQQCGRVVCSDFHVAADDLRPPSVSSQFPTACVPGSLTPQEKALELMLFDLSSCIQKDTDPSKPPPR